MNAVENITSPVGELQWIFITGKGKKDLQGNDRFVASLVLPTDSDECKAFTGEINDFWEENKPKGGKVKSLGFKETEDENGKPTGFTSFNFWTGTQYPDESDKVVKTFTAKGAEVTLGSKKIGNGSRGRIKGAMAIYDQGVAARGVTLYLNGIQLTKFIEFKGGVDFDAVEDEDGGTFEGFDDEDSMNAVTESENPAPQPRL